ncbi:hypothetical protein LSCM1_02076 [Leishmania martiniquensis]|uniref:Uncharacterized protein n=1 Tax=Leishmania martiniquensis TaxID=1580590 RepID=A0A836G502_9TRYP|nr:hypothetical protein LSCM1_02076 [Leishmania martiniquensis]
MKPVAPSHLLRWHTRHTQLLGIRTNGMPLRCCASVPLFPLLSAAATETPTLHQSVASAHMHASCLLAQLWGERMPSSLEAFVSSTEEWWKLVERLVQLPVVTADLGQLLVETAHADDAQRDIGGAEFEERVVAQWEEWVWSSVPCTVPAPAAREADGSEDEFRVPPTGTLSFTQFADLLHSYDRYRRGVRWGASRDSGDWASNGGDAAAAAYYRRRYFLHPWHGMHCPTGTAEQIPYVHLLQWMLARRGGSGEATPSATDLWERHRALEPFQPSSPSFKALDVCCQSGYVLDLLIRAGAGVVVASDSDPAALANTESTFHECMRESRGRHRNPVLYTRRCEGLPAPAATRAGSSSGGSIPLEPRRGGAGVGTGAEVQVTSASAAERRRRRAREEARGYSALVRPIEEGACCGAESVGADAAAGPFDVLYIHPPTAASLWPVVTTEQFNLRKTMWWRRLNRSAKAEGLDTAFLLPYLPCAAAPALARHNPLATRSGLQQVLDALRADVTEHSGVLLTDEGYVVLVLARTYDTDLLLRGETLGMPSLADLVIAQLNGYYDLILRRRCSMHASRPARDAAQSSNAVGRMLLSVFRESQLRAEGAASAAAAEWAAEVERISREDMWHDVLVLRKNRSMARRCDARRRESLRQDTAAAGSVEWEDSFEYNEYYPRGAVPHTSHHWTALVPSYSYLEKDFYDSPSAERNFLAVGHPLPANSAVSAGYGVPGAATPSAASAVEPDQGTNGVAEASKLASANFRTVFAQELRTRRRSKLRKLALSPLELQEWYIDEKLVRSSAAKLELLNELSKWDLKDYDN